MLRFGAVPFFCHIHSNSLPIYDFPWQPWMWDNFKQEISSIDCSFFWMDMVESLAGTWQQWDKICSLKRLIKNDSHHHTIGCLFYGHYFHPKALPPPPPPGSHSWLGTLCPTFINLWWKSINAMRHGDKDSALGDVGISSEFFSFDILFVDLGDCVLFFHAISA